MVLSAKQKRIFNLALIIVLVAVLLSGIGIGIYFILMDRDELTARQKQFGSEINLSIIKAETTETDVSSLPAGFGNNIVAINDNYLLTKNQNGVDEIYSLTSGSTVSINSLVLYDNVELLCGNFAIVSYEGVNKLVDLKTGDLICTLSNADYIFSGNHLLIKSNDGEKLKYVPNNQTDVNYVAVLFNTQTNSAVCEIKDVDNCIDFNLGVNYASVVYKDKTDVYSLSDFTLVRSFENVGEKNFNKYNIESTVDDEKYYMSQHHRVFELSKNVLLIEKAVVENDSSLVTVAGILNDGSTQGYKLSYQIYDIVSDELTELKSDGCVVKPIKINLSDDYFAVLLYDVDTEFNLKEDSIKISYFTLETNKSDRKMQSLVSYDYIKNGLICGFNGTKLLTQGGENSKPISFSGKERGNIVLNEGCVLSGTNNKNVLIETSMLGQKRILSNYGKALVEGLFLEISPFEGNFAIARDAEKYYVVSAFGQKTEIKNFAEEFKAYIFSGIGVYITSIGNNLYNVYNLDGSIAFENARLTLNYDVNTNEILLYVDSNSVKLIKISPITNYAAGTQPESGGAYGFLEINSNKNFGQAGEVKTLSTEDKLEASIISVDETFGNGESKYELEFNISDIKSKFKSYDSLSESEKSLIPAFDNKETLSYTSQNKNLVFDGAYFVAGDNLIVVIIRLTCDNQNFFMANIAFKDVYLKNLSAGFNKNNVAKIIYNNKIVDAELDLSKNYLPAISMTGVGLTYFDETINSQRTVDYSIAGYDGGLVLAFGNATKIGINLSLSNVYVGKNYDSGFIDLENQTLDLGKYSVSIDEFNGKKYVTISASEGYFLTGFNLLTYKNVASTYDLLELIQQKTFSSLCVTYKFELTTSGSEISYIRFTGVNLVERYNKLKFVDYNDLVVDSVYYFHGYGEDLGKSNPAYLGFDNFNRKETILVPSYRIGYIFDGYNFNGNLIVDKNGNFVGTLSDLNFNYKVNGPQTLVFDATYTAKEFNVYFVDGLDALAGEERVVIFDSVIENFPEVERVGYNLEGWYDSNGNKYTKETIYQVDSHSTLTAKWKAEEYELKFDINTAEYSNLIVNGYDYTVKSAQFTKKFNDFRVGSNFKNVTKTITFDGLYGELPYIMGCGKSDDIYMFLGWFENSSSENKGEEYLNSSKVTIDSARTLYAHYTKEIYSIKLEVNEDFMDKLAEVKYTGATSSGLASSFSTIAGNAENLILFTNNELVLYTLQSKTINIGVDLLPGYHIEEMSVDYAGETYYYDKSALSPTGRDFSFTDTETAAGNISVSATNNEGYSLQVGLNMTEGLSTNEYDAQIKLLAAETMTTINLSSSGNVAIKDSENKDFSGSEEVPYLTTKSYTLEPTTFNGVRQSYLESLQIGTTTWKFSLNYEYNDSSLDPYNSDLDAVIIDLEEASFNGDNRTYNYYLVSGSSGETERIQQYSFPKSSQEDVKPTEVTLIVKYNVLTGQYSYTLQVVARAVTYNITANFEDITGEVTLTSQSLGCGSIDTTSSIIDGNGDRIGNYEKSTDIANFTIKPSANTFISRVFITYGDVLDELVLASNFQVSSNQSLINSTFINTMSSSKFISNTTNKVKIKATNVELEWLSNSRSLTIKVNNIMQKLTINVEYVQYKMVQISMTDGNDYAIDPSSGINLSEFEVRDIGVIETEGTYKIKNEEKTLFTLVYFGEDLAVEFKTASGNTAIYQVNLVFETKYDPIGDSVIIGETVQIPKNVTESFFLVGAFAREFTMASYLGVSDNEYVLDNGNYPKEGASITKNFYIDYYASANVVYITEKSYKNYLNTDGSVQFHGQSLWVYYAATLDDGKYELNRDKSGVYDNYGNLINSVESDTLTNFTLFDLSISNYSIRLYYDVKVSYVVKYEIYCTNGNTEEVEINGIMSEEKCYYNAFGTFPECGYSIYGYDFLGYSTEMDNGIEYTVGTTRENLTDEDGVVVTLYCVFSPKTFTINFNTNRGSGSSEPSSVSGTYEVSFDSTFNTLPTVSRTGYSFVGWYTANENGSEVDSGFALSAANYVLFETKDDSSVTLYAHWSAKTYTIAFDTNKGIGSTDPSTVDGIYEIAFDSVFPTLPTITRTGYTFTSWATGTTTQGEASVNSGSLLSYDIYNMLDDKTDSSETCEITLYAIWTANKYTLTISLSELLPNLVSYLSDSERLLDDCPIVINGTNYYTPDAVITFDVYFDSPILGALPEITVTGYKDDCLNFNWNGVNLTDSTKFNNELQTKVTANLKNEEQRIQYTLTNSTTTFKSVVFSDSNPLFGTDVILTIEVSEVQYIKSLLFTFGSGVTYQIDAGWDSTNSEVYVDVNKNGSYDSSEEISSRGLELEGYVANAFNSISIKQPETGKFDIEISFVKNDIEITEGSIENRTYSVNCYYKIDDSDSIFKETKTIVTGNNLTNELEPYYIMGSTFLGWYYDESETSHVDANAGITSNGNIYAIYDTSSTEHSVSFYYWDITQDKYVESARETYTLWESGESFASTASQYFNTANISTAGGRTIKMPSPASEIWPTGTYFAGYIIINSNYTPKNYKYYTTSDLYSSSVEESKIRNGQRTLFDNTNMVDSSLKVYAMYDKYEFTVSGDINISFGEILPDGTVDKFTSSDATIVYVTNVDTYKANIQKGMSREAALTNAGYSTTGSGAYVAVIFKTNSSGEKYVYAVSDNYVASGTSYYYNGLQWVSGTPS